MIILGIDPGISNCGLAIFDSYNKEYRTFLLTSEMYKDHNTKIKIIGIELEKIIKKYKNIDYISYEKVYVFKNLVSVIGVAGIIGIINHLATKYKIPSYDFTPNEIKKEFIGYGIVEKEDIIHMMRFLFNNKFDKISNHETDALAMAITLYDNLKKEKEYVNE